MAPPIQRDNARLIAVGSTLLHFCNRLGLFHYNKLLYLFEYFHIKNFGKRFTKEVFLKLPHGPAIVGYKAHIGELTQIGAAVVDLAQLRAKREVDDFFYPKVCIKVSDGSAARMLTDSLLLDFTQKLCRRFGHLDVKALEAFVYKTEPMVNYTNSSFKKTTGGYVLTADCIRMKDHSGAQAKGRALLREHLEKYPTIDYEQQRRLVEEFTWLARLRPEE